MTRSCKRSVIDCENVDVDADVDVDVDVDVSVRSPPITPLCSCAKIAERGRAIRLCPIQTKIARQRARSLCESTLR